MKLLLIFACVAAAAAAEEPQVLKEFVAGNLQYVGELYRQLAKEHRGNFVACPLSIQSVFALMNGGAKGNTSAQIATALRLPENETKVRETFLELNANLQRNPNYTLSTANKIYVAENFNISSGYRTTAVEVFNAEIQNIDFADSKHAIPEINGWVENKTHDKIKDLVNEDMIGADTVAVLINALYFQGKWVRQFDNDTKRLPFYHSKKGFIVADMMNVEEHFNYYESSALRAKYLELPYDGEDVTMTFVLPKDIEGLSALEDRIAEVLAAPKFETVFIDVQIPKFKIEATTHLIPVLRAMGIEDAFTGLADFSGIGANQEPLTISEVVQKAFIEVDEKGTTAAAATVIVVNRSGVEEPLTFIADHPFLFYLKHKTNGVLFIGRYSVPDKAS